MSRREPEPAGGETGNEPFLERWSRLKSVTRESGQPGAPEADASQSLHVPATTDEEAPPASTVARALPDLESLDQDSDYSAFLGPDVDPSLRRMALRKLFRSPKFNVCDGLDDYCGDFTSFAPMGDIVTADMRHHIERAAREVMAACDEPAPQAQRIEGDAITTAAIQTDDSAEPPTGRDDEDDDHAPA